MFGNFDIYLVTFLTALVVTYLLTPLVRGVACRFGIMDLPNERRPHKHPTARGGGLAIVLGVNAACLIALMFPDSLQPAGYDVHWYLGFLPACLVLLAVGLVDDIRGMKPWMKLLGQILAAALIALSGTRFGKLFGYELPPMLDSLMVVVWIVAVINAFNLIDGLDGLASGLAVISATGLGGIMLIGHLSGSILVLLALAGACLAFLRYNFHPATIFLGDTGSMFIGLVLGMISLQTVTKNTFFLSLTIPLLVLGVPIYDTLLAIWRRSVRQILSGGEKGKPAGIMQADMDHLHHRLLKSGLSTRRVATILCILNGGFVGFGLLMATFKSHAYGFFLLALLAAAYVLLRRMAVIELRDTGKMMLTGLRRPTHSQFKAMVYPVWDMVCLSGSLALAMRLFEGDHPAFAHDWFLDLPIWVTPTFSLLALSRVYITVWTRARLLDVLMLLFTLQAGLVMSLGIALLIDPNNATTWLLRALVMGSVGHCAIVGFRLTYRCIEEIVLYLKSSGDGMATAQRVLLYGAGGRCQLFLRERGFNDSSSFYGQTVVGLIDDEPTLHFKWVHGHRVLGGLDGLPQIIARHRIAGIVITAKLKPESLAKVRELAHEHRLNLSEWRFEIHTLGLPET